MRTNRPDDITLGLFGLHRDQYLRQHFSPGSPVLECVRDGASPQVSCRTAALSYIHMKLAYFLTLNAPHREVESIIGSLWKEMSVEDKQLWKQKASEQNARVRDNKLCCVLGIRIKSEACIVLVACLCSAQHSIVCISSCALHFHPTMTW